ncbi:MAG: hypothetical protein JKZ00_02420 [Flavobacteriaceae bacterium]|nr:hypothetical protein [Flavobacteriaceae bacterium]
MKKIIVLFSMVLLCGCVTQKFKKFKAGVKIVSLERIDSYEVPKSILFEFEGHTHKIYYYLDLSEKLKASFKESSIRIHFNYNLKASNPLKEDLKITPKHKYDSKNYEFVGKVNFLALNSSKSYVNVKNRKVNYTVSFTFSKKNIIALEYVFDVNSYFTILTQSTKLSKLLFEKITFKPPMQ